MFTLKNLLDVVGSITSGKTLKSKNKEVQKVYDLFKEIKNELESLTNLNEQDFYLNETTDFNNLGIPFLTGTFSKIITPLNHFKDKKEITTETEDLIKQNLLLLKLQEETLKVILPNNTQQIEELFKGVNEEIKKGFKINEDYSGQNIDELIEGKDIAISKSFLGSVDN